MATLIIAPEEVSKNTQLKGNIDSDRINPHILSVQDLYLGYILGNKLLAKLLDIIASGTMNDAANEKYKTLWNQYVRPFMWHMVAFKVVEFISFTVGESGVQQKAQDQGVPATGGDRASIMASYRTNAQGYQNLLVDYLCSNSQDYPEFIEYQGQGKQKPILGYDNFTGWETY